MIHSRLIACLALSVIAIALVPKLLFGNAPPRNSVSRLTTKRSFEKVRYQTGVWERAARTEPAAAAQVDALFEQLLSHDAPPPPIVSDEQFIRRVFLDLTGKLPTTEEVRQFEADSDVQKRSKLIDRLLQSDAYAAN